MTEGFANRIGPCVNVTVAVVESLKVCVWLVVREALLLSVWPIVCLSVQVFVVLPVMASETDASGLIVQLLETKRGLLCGKLIVLVGLTGAV